MHYLYGDQVLVHSRFTGRDKPRDRKWVKTMGPVMVVAV